MSAEERDWTIEDCEALMEKHTREKNPVLFEVAMEDVDKLMEGSNGMRGMRANMTQKLLQVMLAGAWMRGALSVIDSARGMTSEELEKAFGRWRR